MSPDQPPQTLTLIAVPPPPPPSPAMVAAAELGAAALGLIAAIVFVRHRLRGEGLRAPGPGRRAAIAAAAFSAAAVGRSQAYRVVADPRHAFSVFDIAIAAALLWLGATLLFALADAVLAGLDPRRNRGWLVAAPILFAVLVHVPLHFTQVSDGDWLAAMVAIALNGAAAGLVWWALLPAAREELARRFA